MITGKDLNLTDHEFDAWMNQPILGRIDNIMRNFIKNIYSIAGLDYKLAEEVDTGTKWVDGSHIYQQTFSMTDPGIGDILLAHGITGLDVIVSSIEGYCVLADGTKITLPVINHESSGGAAGTGSAANTITLVEWDGTNLLGYIGTAYTLTKAVSELTFTIQYTKTV